VIPTLTATRVGCVSHTSCTLRMQVPRPRCWVVLRRQGYDSLLIEVDCEEIYPGRGTRRGRWKTNGIGSEGLEGSQKFSEGSGFRLGRKQSKGPLSRVRGGQAHLCRFHTLLTHYCPQEHEPYPYQAKLRLRHYPVGSAAWSSSEPTSSKSGSATSSPSLLEILVCSLLQINGSCCGLA
jgi:hypothetical protein